METYALHGKEAVRLHHVGRCRSERIDGAPCDECKAASIITNSATFSVVNTPHNRPPLRTGNVWH
jgi:hypothetical protein